MQNNIQNPKYLLGKGCVCVSRHVIGFIIFHSSLECRFANPLLSVAGQRLVMNLKGLKTHIYATRDLSREVDRQLAAAFDETDDPIVLENGDPEIGREASEK